MGTKEEYFEELGQYGVFLFFIPNQMLIYVCKMQYMCTLEIQVESMSIGEDLCTKYQVEFQDLMLIHPLDTQQNYDLSYRKEA